MGSAAFIFLLLGSMTAPSQGTQNNQVGTNNKSTKLEYVFDVPSLVGRNVDEVRSVLGEPTDKDKEPTALQSQMGVDEWQNTFTKEGRELLVTYNPTTRKIVDFFISKNNADTDDSLLEAGNLTEQDSRYKIEFVKALRNPSEFTGVKVMPL